MQNVLSIQKFNSSVNKKKIKEGHCGWMGKHLLSVLNVEATGEKFGNKSKYIPQY